METNKNNFTWNNTDWSVSDFEVKVTNHTQGTESMNKQIPQSAPQTTFPPRHITIDERRAVSTTERAQNGLDELLENASREAASLAWSTGFPFLLLPCLKEELENHARNYWSRQTRIQKESSQLLRQTFPFTSHRLAA